MCDKICDENFYIIFMYWNPYWYEYIEIMKILNKTPNIKLFFETTYRRWPKICDVVFNNEEHFEIVEFLVKNKCVLNWKAIAYAANRGYFKTVSFLHLNDAPITYKGIKCAVVGGHSECANYLLNIKQDCYMKVILKKAFEGGSLNIIQYLFEEYSHSLNFDEAIELSYYYGRLDCLIFLHKFGCKINSKYCIIHIQQKKGNVEILKYTHKNMIKYKNVKHRWQAVENGEWIIDCLQYIELHENKQRSKYKDLSEYLLSIADECGLIINKNSNKIFYKYDIMRDKNNYVT